ncbi:MAG: tRNA (adenosine(37)-N6)-threonylcarbamoyltransferase complex dimerization subunit type 1 TsaB [Flavobacteriales bacterium]|nr:tRNA (adenosine(37)-N6)-threonylcarbamoyltransferase complex dimerization subunit type 1 TsaB [Flavobacteriales bacterium]
MSNLLYLETSSKNCSVGISRNGKLLALEELSEASFSHAEKLHPFINGVLEKAALSMTDLSGVVVGKGPGSYTGLRIGVAAAKGLCFALQIPLVGVGSLETLAEAVCSQTSAFIIPLIDARRMEVFTAVFDTRGKQIESPWAEVLESNSFSPYLDKNKCLFVGDGQEKFQKILNHPNAVFEAEILQPSVQQMVRLGTQKFEAKAFEDLAYFEPFYLKEFYTTPPKS